MRQLLTTCALLLTTSALAACGGEDKAAAPTEQTSPEQTSLTTSPKASPKASPYDYTDDLTGNGFSVLGVKTNPPGVQKLKGFNKRADYVYIHLKTGVGQLKVRTGIGGDDFSLLDPEKGSGTDLYPQAYATACLGDTRPDADMDLEAMDKFEASFKGIGLPPLKDADSERYDTKPTADGWILCKVKPSNRNNISTLRYTRSALTDGEDEDPANQIDAPLR